MKLKVGQRVRLLDGEHAFNVACIATIDIELDRGDGVIHAMLPDVGNSFSGSSWYYQIHEYVSLEFGKKQLVSMMLLEDH